MMDAIIDKILQDQRGRYYFLFDCAEYGDQLKVLKFSIDEHVSKPFKIKLQLTTREKVDPRKLNDRFARLTIVDKHHANKRHYCGIVSKAVQKDKGFDSGFTRFNVTIRPELHFAKMIYDNRIYQQQTIPQIVEQVLKESGVTRFRWHLLEPHEQREYVVQYKRSNLQFIERLLASEGISYRFDHKEDGCELVMFDKSIETETCAGAEELEYNSTAGSEVRGQSIKRFAWTEAVTTNVATYREQHFKNPEVLYTQQWGTRTDNGQQRVLEKYSFPGYYKSDEAGKRAARYEADSLQADASEGSGMGHAQFLSAGRMFKMLGHDEDRYNTKYFLVSVSQQGRQPNVEEEFASDEDSTFLKTKFTCVRLFTPWRPKRPEAQQTDGDHLATVVGPEGEEIYCDEFGRIKIFYHWDRKGKKDDSASCWVRVSQNWAGSQYGGIMIPRVGQSVVVSYINGDVEQPLVSGRVFNSVEQVPYGLPNNKTRMTIKSQTHKGAGFNEFRFEDEKGGEEVFLRAERDLSVRVKNNSTYNIDGNYTSKINKNLLKFINGNSIYQSSKGFSMSVGYDIKNNSFLNIVDLGDDLLNKAINNLDYLDDSGQNNNFILSVAGRTAITSSNNFNITSWKRISMRSSSDLIIKSSDDVELHAEKNVDLSAAKHMSLVGGDTAKISSGGAFVYLNENTVYIKSDKIIIEASESVDIKGSIVNIKGNKINMN